MTGFIALPAVNLKKRHPPQKKKTNKLSIKIPKTPVFFYHQKIATEHFHMFVNTHNSIKKKKLKKSDFCLSVKNNIKKHFRTRYFNGQICTM